MRSLKVLFTLAIMMFASVITVYRGDADTKEKKEITFSKDVAPIIYANCASCHRPNHLAPMSFLTYKEVRPWARSIREQVVTRQMPPWHADPRYGEFANDPRLSQKEIDTLVAWVNQDAKEGDPKDLPPVPRFPEGWTIGKPDLVVPMAAEPYTVPVTGVDEYNYFRVPTNFKEDMWVQALEVIPGNRKVVHHATVHMTMPDKSAAAKPAEQDGPQTASPWKKYYIQKGKLQFISPDAPVINDGCSAMEKGTYPEPVRDEVPGFGVLGGYLPGKAADIRPAGFAFRIPAGATLVFQVHYSNSTGEPQKDLTKIGLVFAKGPVKAEVKHWEFWNNYFEIPAGADNHEVTSCYTLKKDVQILSYTAHMHYRGKDMKFEAVYPDGRRETIFSVPNYNFNWQQLYTLKNPKPLPKGTKLLFTAHFDNSAKNKFNPDLTQVVRWGEPSDTEMMGAWLEYMEDKPAETNLETSAAKVAGQR